MTEPEQDPTPEPRPAPAPKAEVRPLPAAFNEVLARLSRAAEARRNQRDRSTG
jgi:hypothetical protein